MRVAVIGATGNVGARAAVKFRHSGAELVEISRSHGVDLISGDGLPDALAGVDAAIDASAVARPQGGAGSRPSGDESTELHQALTAATRNVVDACSRHHVEHLVFLSIASIEKPAFDDFPYYVAKRAQERIVATSEVPSTTVKATQFHEFAANPVAVTAREDEVLVEDWLMQPVSAASVADVLVETALGNEVAPMKTIAGPEVSGLPELAAKLLAHHGDRRPVRALPSQLAAFGAGALVAPDDAAIIGPDIDSWLLTGNARSTWLKTLRP